MDYWKQHFVTESYLKAWCDPETPDNGAFVWRVSKKDRTICMKSPKSLFSEPDFYTVYDSTGKRILELEHKLKEVEDRFIVLRNEKLQRHLPLTPDDRKTIALFLSSMFARTRFQKEMQKELWKEFIQSFDKLPKEISSYLQQIGIYEHARMLREQPMPFHMFYFVNLATPILFRMNCAIYETNDESSFITSDNPCLWNDPVLIYPDEPISFFGLGSSKLSVMLPISPKQTISLLRGGLDGYFIADSDYLEMVNGLIAATSREFIVANRKEFNTSLF